MSYTYVICTYVYVHVMLCYVICTYVYLYVGAAAYAEDRFGIDAAAALRGGIQAFAKGEPLGEIDFSAVADALF